MKIALTKSDSKFNRFTDWLEKYKVDFDVLDYENSKEDLKKIDHCSGLILSGGADVYPEIYCDWDTVETKGTYQPERDGFELNLISRSIELNLPVLAVCRGLQLMNVYFRGSLIFDIEDIRKVNHRKISDTEDRMHSITIFENTLLRSIAKEETATVNSSHHQSADRLGEGIMINAKSDDGIVEGIEYSDKTGKPFFLGVQWHPERFPENQKSLSESILKNFINACENHSV